MFFVVTKSTTHWYPGIDPTTVHCACTSLEEKETDRQLSTLFVCLTNKPI